MSKSLEEEQQPKLAKLFSLSRQEIAIVIQLAIANFISTITFSSIAPYYPFEGAKRGLTESQNGLVFGIFELTMFIVSPIAGKLITKTGSKNMFVVGLALTSITAMLFGLLELLPNHLFYYGSLIVRVFIAFGDAAFVTSSFTIVATRFQKDCVIVISIFETAAGVGFLAGPPIGGILYEWGGFKLPMIVLSIALAISAIVSAFLIPPDKHVSEEDTKKSSGVMRILKLPGVWIHLYSVLACAVCLSLLDPTLADHLQSFNMGPFLVGLLFLLCGCVYTLAAPVWGYLTRLLRQKSIVVIVGTALTAVGMMLIGPAPFIHLDKTILIISVSLVLLGIACAALYVPSFQNCIDVVKSSGLTEKYECDSCISGIFQSAWALGAFLGPSLGGLATQYIGFASTAAYIGALQAIYIIVLVLYYSVVGESNTSSEPEKLEIDAEKQID